MWVERTGASFRWMPELSRTFPDGRYVHIHRDGLEAALSMREHNWFVLAAEFFENPPDPETLQAAFEHPGTGDDDPYARFYGAAMPALEKFARYWSYLIANGVRALDRLDPAQVLEIYFEDLCASPASTLTRIAEFFELPDDPGWIDRAAAEVTGDVHRRALELSVDERHRAEVACRPGQVLLGREDPERGGSRMPRSARRSRQPRTRSDRRVLVARTGLATHDFVGQ